MPASSVKIVLHVEAEGPDSPVLLTAPGMKSPSHLTVCFYYFTSFTGKHVCGTPHGVMLEVDI